MNEVMYRYHKAVRWVATLLVIILVVAMLAFFDLIFHLNGDAAIVNQMGMIRGEAQRLFKQELTHHPDDALLNRVDSRISGVGEYVQLMNDEAFVVDYVALEQEWKVVKLAIAEYRSGNHGNKLYELSEKFYRSSDDLVYDAQYLAERKMETVVFFRLILIIAAVPLLIAYVVLLVYSLKMSLRYRNMQNMAFIDSMTGVSNRNHFNNVTQEYRSQAGLPEDLYCLFLDLNNLKVTNDTLGHDAGNRLLEQFSLVVLEVCRVYGTVFRYGGDEFIALLKASSLAEIEGLLVRINERIDEWNGKNPIQISFACGITSATEAGIETIDDLIELADMRMYENKLKMKSSEVMG